jgi:hypothetical protein
LQDNMSCTAASIATRPIPYLSRRYA